MLNKPVCSHIFIATSRNKSAAGLWLDIFHTLDLFIQLLSQLSNTEASNDCTTETQSYPSRFFVKIGSAPVSAAF